MKNIHKLNGHLLYPLLFSGICYLVSSQLVITMPRTSFPRHSEINDSSATYVEVVSLEDVQQLEEILSGHDLILSFITYDGYLLVQGKSVTSSVYSLGETIRDLVGWSLELSNYIMKLNQYSFYMSLVLLPRLYIKICIKKQRQHRSCIFRNEKHSVEMSSL